MLLYTHDTKLVPRKIYETSIIPGRDLRLDLLEMETLLEAEGVDVHEPELS
jgi:hypothetical protein